jgi:protein arginine N-methyltransferase 1
MYSRHAIFDYHGSLLADRERTEAFESAIRATVKPGQVVVDLGCGTGILSYFACRAGARRVYSIERSEIIDVARAVAAANGLADRVTFVEGSSKGIVLPERGDVLVSETLGNGGLEENILGYVADARERLLVDGATIVPGKVDVVTAAVHFPDGYAKLIDIWDRAYDIDLGAARAWASQQSYPITLDPSEICSAVETVASLDLQKTTSSFVAGQVRFAFDAATTVHGFGVWFRAELSPGVVLSNAPPRRTSSWSHLFLPLRAPLNVGARSFIHLAISTLDGLVWRWQGHVSTGGGGERAERFDQSTFAGFPWSRARMSGAADSFVPEPSVRTEAARFVADRLGRGETIEAIAAATAVAFPHLFATGWSAKEFVRRLVQLCAS